MRFQDEGWDPFERAMASDRNGETTPEDLDAAFKYRFDKEAQERTLPQSIPWAIDRLGFDDGDDFRGWLGNEFTEEVPITEF